MKQNKIFSKDNFKGLEDDLQNEIIRRFNDYDTLMRILELTATNLINLKNTSKSLSDEDKKDIRYLAGILNNATDKDWLKDNVLYY